MTTGIEWFNVNESRRYPLADDADVGALPDGVIADLKLVVPAEVMAQAGGGLPRIVSVSCGPTYISVVIAVGNKEVAWYGGERVVHQPLALVPLVTGAGGFVVFGSGADSWLGVAMLPNGVLAVSAFSVVFGDGVESIVFESDGSATDLTDLIWFNPGPDIVMTFRGDLGGYKNVIEFAIAATISAGTNEELLGNCGKNVQANSCTPEIINAVNGVRADAAGKLTIRIVNNTLNSLDLAGANTAVVGLITGMSLTRACMDKYVLLGPPDISSGLVKKC